MHMRVVTPLMIGLLTQKESFVLPSCLSLIWLVFYRCDSLFFNLLQWDLEALPNGRYTVSIHGAPTGELEELLYAFLIEPEKAEEWIITRTERHNEYGYKYT